MKLAMALCLAIGCGMLVSAGRADDKVPSADEERQLARLLNSPLLFVKRHSYTNMHIYDTYYKWPPGGGGIFVLENPSAPRSEWRIRPVIDPETPETRGFGLGLCRARGVDPKNQRIRQLVNGYAHSVKPVDDFARRAFPIPDSSGMPIVSFASTQSEDYQSMLAIIRQGQKLALAAPRVDMPGAKIVPGESRQLIALSLPERLPALRAMATAKGVLLSWDRRADLSGLTFELHRGGSPGFTPDETNQVVSLTRFDYLDPAAPPGRQHYALSLVADGQRSPPVRVSVSVIENIHSGDIPSPGEVNRTARLNSLDRSTP